jgi:hypothetical protein
VIVEAAEQRVLGAVRFVDATNHVPIARRFRVHARGVRFANGPRQLALIVRATGFDDYIAAFGPPLPDVAATSFAATVHDPAGQYLPRAFSIDLPRSTVPTDPSSVFQPLDVALLPGATAPINASWAQARITIRVAGSSALRPNVLARAVGPGEAPGTERLLGIGMSDARGEALVVLPSAPFTRPNSGAGPAMTGEIPLRLELVPLPLLDGGELAIIDWTAFTTTIASAANRVDATLPGSRKLSLEVSVTT